MPLSELQIAQSLAIFNVPRPETNAEEAAAAMPPPTQTISFLSPPIPSFTVQQLLAHTIPVAPPPSSRSCGSRPVPNSLGRPSHSSSKLNEKYEPILAESLYPDTPAIVSDFRDRIRAISRAATITFQDPLVLPWDACSMLSEGMVTSYLDTQVLFAAWQAVLRMVPAIRNYDLEMVKQAPIEVMIFPQVAVFKTSANNFVERGARSNVRHDHSRGTSDPGYRRVQSSRDRNGNALGY